MLSPSDGQVTHVLLTRSPLGWPVQAPVALVRLACIRHAASVRPEPGSNSHENTFHKLLKAHFNYWLIVFLLREKKLLFLHFREVPTHLVCLLCLVFKGQRRFTRQLLYIIIGIVYCQQLFEIYFKFLFRNRFKCERSLTVFIIYHS